MKTSFSDFVKYIKESASSDFELNEAIVIKRDFLKELGEIATPLFTDLAENIDQDTTFEDLYFLLNSKEILNSGFFEIFGLVSDLSSTTPILKKMVDIENSLKNHINNYIIKEYLNESNLTEEEKFKVLLSKFIIKPDTSWHSEDFDTMLYLHQKSNSTAFRGGKDSLINKIIEQDEKVKEKLEEEFNRFSEFIDISSGAGFGQRTKKNEHTDDNKNPNINDLFFEFVIKFDFSLILFYTFVILSKYGFLKKSIDDMIPQFIQKRFVPFISHEITHYIQKLKTIFSTKKLINIGKYKNPEDINTEEEFSSWVVDYLSEPIEIGAHASEFVETILANYPDKTYKEILNMLKYNEIPIETSHALKKYLSQFRELTKDSKVSREYIVNRFKKTVFKILQEYEEQERN